MTSSSSTANSAIKELLDERESSHRARVGRDHHPMAVSLVGRGRCSVGRK